MIGEKFYIYAPSMGVVEYIVKEILDSGRIRMVKTGTEMKVRAMTEAKLRSNYFESAEEAKVNWYMSNIKGKYNEIKLHETSITRLKDEITLAKETIDYDALKEEHPDLFV